MKYLQKYEEKDLSSSIEDAQHKGSGNYLALCRKHLNGIYSKPLKSVLCQIFQFGKNLQIWLKI